MWITEVEVLEIEILPSDSEQRIWVKILHAQKIQKYWVFPNFSPFYNGKIWLENDFFVIFDFHYH